MSNVMTPAHSNWQQFCELLEGLEGCDFKEEREGDPNSITWSCGGGNDKTKARQILAKYFPLIDADRSCQFFDDHGGHCDCEILFNVADASEE